jgi:uncharacterized RDD family membrane protein YckC
MEPVGVLKRAIALIIDMIVVGVPLGLASTMMMGSPEDPSILPIMILSLVGIAYFIVLEKVKGQTVGKMVMSLKVVKKDGSAMDWQASVIRNLLRIVDGQFAYLLGAIIIMVSKSKQRLGDMAASTIVVSTT